VLLVGQDFIMKKSLRRKQAYQTPNIIKPGMKYDDIKKDALEPIPEYDEWSSVRDGMFNFPAKERKEREIKKKRTFKINV
jgi:hypothetical protein